MPALSSPSPAAVDLLIVGGGINGVGIARDAAGRGLSVLLCEKGDLAGATSSASSKLIHGGLRYLEYGEFRLVREALREREVLLASARHIIRPLRFVLPHDRRSRPRWMIRAGLFLYDHLGGRRELPATETIDAAHHPFGAPLRQGVRTAFIYSDCWVDDARLVILAARDAKQRGATILTHTALIAARREDGLWRATLADAAGRHTPVSARVLVNAGGPWVKDVLRRSGLEHRHAELRLVKGSHIVVPRLYEGEHAYLLQNDDRRVIFVLPFAEAFTLIGTTDVSYAGDPAQVATNAEEVDYLCRAVSSWFARPLERRQVIWTYAGVRPLHDDHAANAAAVTRDYLLDLDGEGAPILSVFGGKITTHRRLAEHALEKLRGYFPAMGRPWTASARLPGGDLPEGGAPALAAMLVAEHPWLDRATAVRLAGNYGSLVRDLLAGAHRREDLGEDFGAGLAVREVDWLVNEEWARSADDILWRRSKLGLRFAPPEQQALARYLVGRR
ncbi:MAG TPA: glycerol-3-phosphate dehydrogenase [Stellaceae bacterium]|nr:glycerol-3-phosphate dehydrogenase [Stellaceae bacterium]